MAGLADVLGVQWTGEDVRVRFLNRDFIVTPRGLYDETGTPPVFAVSVVLFRYLLHFKEQPHRNGYPDAAQDCRWTAYKEFKDAAPLIHYFTNETEAAIARNFSGRVPELSEACRRLGGKVSGDGLSCDLAMQVPVLPRMPLFLVFYDADAEFPSTCSVLFERRAGMYLDMESLAIVGALFSKTLAESLKPV